MELHRLRCFVAVAEAQSFTQAAARLRFAPSNLTQHVQHLERELGFKLFERTSRRVRLTPAGDVVLDRARQILAEVDDLRELAHQAALGHVGTVRACYCPGAGHLVAALTRAVAGSLPDVRLDFHLRQTAEVAEDVARGDASLGMCRLVIPPLKSLVLTSEPQSYLAIPAGHPLAARREILLQDLNDQPFIVIAEETQPHFHRQQLRYFEEQGLRPVLQPFPIKSVEQCVELVAAGHGVIMMSPTSMANYPRPAVVARPIVGEVPNEVHYLVWRPSDDSPQVAAIVALASALAA
jgi:DNA-binding transcriptional LysR family regulator